MAEKRKGVTMIFEQVILFAISVSIFLVLFAVFTVYQNSYVSLGTENQLDEAKEWISAHILKISQKKNATASIIIPIPRRIGDAVYEVSLSQEGLNVTNLLTNATKSSTLYNLGESFTLSGKVISIKGKITIKKENSTIIIV